MSFRLDICLWHSTCFLRKRDGYPIEFAKQIYRRASDIEPAKQVYREITDCHGGGEAAIDIHLVGDGRYVFQTRYMPLAFDMFPSETRWISYRICEANISTRSDIEPAKQVYRFWGTDCHGRKRPRKDRGSKVGCHREGAIATVAIRFLMGIYGLPRRAYALLAMTRIFEGAM